MDEKEYKDFSHLPENVLQDEIGKFLYNGIYILIVTNLTCSYKVAMLGIFLTQDQLVQALKNYFKLPLEHVAHLTTYNQIVRHIYTMMHEDFDPSEYFDIALERYVEDIDLNIDPYTNEIQMPVPENFLMRRLYDATREEHKNEYNKLRKFFKSQKKKLLYRQGDADTLYVLLCYANYIPAYRTAHRHDPVGGKMYTKCLGLFTDVRDVVNQIIKHSLDEIDRFLQTYNMFGPNGESIGEKQERIESYQLTLGDIELFMTEYNGPFTDNVEYKYALQQYNMYIPDHMLALPLDLTRRVNVIGRDEMGYNVAFF